MKRGGYTHCSHCGQSWGHEAKGWKHNECLKRVRPDSQNNYCAKCGGKFDGPPDATYVHTECLARVP